LLDGTEYMMYALCTLLKTNSTGNVGKQSGQFVV
jgi:hypothetical protein